MSRTAKADTWMPLYIADYLRKTMHLTRDQHGAYLLLLMACWDRGGRLPNDSAQLAGIARATPAEWRRLAPVILPFFEQDGDRLIQDRVVEEHEKAARLSEARRQAGLQGGRPKKQTKSENESDPKPNAFANGKQTETPARVALPSPVTPPSEDSSVPNGTGAEAPPAEPTEDDRFAETGRIADPGKRGWDGLMLVLTARGGVKDTKARTLIGKWKRDHGLTGDEMWAMAEGAWKAETRDPEPYLAKAAAQIAERRGKAQPTGRTAADDVPEYQQRAWMRDFLESPFQWKRHERGPKPGEPGCKVYPEIQREFGVEPAEAEGAQLLPFPPSRSASA